MAKSNFDVRFKKMQGYGETDGNTIYLDKSKFKGIEGLDSFVHEKNHINNMKASERSIINKTRKEVDGYLSII